MIKGFLQLLFLFITSSLFSQKIDDFNNYLTGSRQVLLVTTENWSSVRGTCMVYERKNDAADWKCVRSFPVMVGRSGLAWDNNTEIPKYTSQKIKHEGDGNSPAGLFRLSTVFGYHATEKLHMPFEKVDSNDICVDDIASAYYNTLSDIDTMRQKDFSSYENMKRNDALYEYGVWVDYNTDPVIPGNGSCIFLHIWKSDSTATSGCTAMSKEDMLWLIHWLNENKKPLLLQLGAG